MYSPKELQALRKQYYSLILVIRIKDCCDTIQNSSASDLMEFENIAQSGVLDATLWTLLLIILCKITQIR